MDDLGGCLMIAGLVFIFIVFGMPFLAYLLGGELVMIFVIIIMTVCVAGLFH